MSIEKIKSKLVWTLVYLGLVVSLISFLENYVPWLAQLCGILGSGCRQTAAFTLFQISIAVWGMIFYVALAAVNGLLRTWMFRLVMVGAGVEATLVGLMASRDLLCLFCLLNAFIMGILLLLFIQRHRIWQCIALFLLGYLVSGYLIARENPPVSQARPDMNGSSIVTRVNRTQITLADLESGIATRLYKMREEIYRLKRERLEELILRALAEQTGTPMVSPDDARLEPLRNVARQVLMTSLQKEPQLDLYLEKPPLPFTRIGIGNSPNLGPADAPVTVIEFSDYLCPACKRVHAVSNELKSIYKGKLRWIFKDFPLEQHPGADKLAEAARCADEQNAFWDFQDFLFAAEQKPDEAQIVQFAQSLKLDIGRFEQCVQSGKYSQEVLNDKRDAQRAGVSMTPSYIINGRLNPGSMSLEGFKQRIDEALRQSE